jgi:hypothetical protein
MGEEQIERANDLFAHDVRADDVVDADIDVGRAVEHVGRAAGRKHRDHQHRTEHDDDEEARDQLLRNVHVGQQRVPPEHAQRHPPEEEPENNRKPAEAVESSALSCRRHVDLAVREFAAVQCVEISHPPSSARRPPKVVREYRAPRYTS